ncbi:MAG TPA: MurT ligase domain-containing protein [Herpetosiphonaceae bacterium]|nr:MurT ligase domain-containing protein [Herpetosiphonaceae bacterium]
MSIREHVALGVARAAQWGTRRLGLGGGTNLPGRVARRIAPDVLRHQAGRLPGGVVLVSGTNGKTTTSRMLAAILAQAGQPALHNRAGANLITGLTAATLDLGIWGPPPFKHAIFEVDEAHLPAAIRETQPRVVLLLNLFRDQLDRYGEVDTLAGKWRAALADLPATATVVLNADDPAIADLAAGLKARVRFYGLEDARHGNDALRHAADSIFCRRCGTPYEYDPAYYGHIGRYRCPNCGHARPTPDIALSRLDLDGTRGSTLRLTVAEDGGSRAVEIKLPLPGLYNALNAAAAAAAAAALGEGLPVVRGALEAFSAAFGRIERFTSAERPVLMALIKNPIGASETVRMLTGAAAAPLNLLVAINDKIADGTDVSWLWDADFEALVGRVRSVVVAGTRAEDMAVRLKYAGLDPALITVQPDLAAAFDAAVAQAPRGAEVTLLPTYTAMLELRETLVERGVLKPFWES